MLVRNQIAYHDYEGVALLEDEKKRLVADLGEKKSYDSPQPWNISCWQKCC
jgi:hypothetical protein